MPSPLASQIEHVASLVRALKEKASVDKAEVSQAVKNLLRLKTEFEKTTGKPWPEPYKKSAAVPRKSPRATQEPPPWNFAAELTAVNRTAIEALAAKVAVASALSGGGEWEHLFMGSFGLTSGARTCTPLVQRASFSRTSVVEAATRRWLATDAGAGTGARQVVVVGAGLDTLPLRLLAEGHGLLVFFELDAEAVLEGKRAALMASPEARSLLLGEDADSGTNSATPAGAWCWQSPHLRMAHADLARGWGSLAAPLLRCGFDPAVPTLFVIECVLSYLPPEGATGILAEAVSLCTQEPAGAAPTKPAVSLVLFEPLRGRGALGAALSEHFKARACPLRAHLADSLAPTADLPGDMSGLRELELLVRAAGWDAVDACDMNEAAQRWIPGEPTPVLKKKP